MGTWALSALLAVIIAGVFTVLDLVRLDRGRDEENSLAVSLGVGVGVFVLLLFVNFLLLFFGRPAMVGPWNGWLWITMPALIALTVFFCRAIAQERWWSAALVVPGGFMALWVLWAGFSVAFTPFGEGSAKLFASQVNLVKADEGDYPPTDADHILQVPQEAALFKARQAIASVPDQPNLSTQYKPGAPVLQSVNNHLYWIFQLTLVGWRVANQVDAVVPGFIVVDAEDPNAQSEVKTGHRMNYSDGAPFGHALHRHIYTHGYRHWKINDLTLEIDDNWQPFFTASLNKPVKNFAGSAPQKMIIVNPETGEITEYALDKIPEWVDRVYSQSVAVDFLTWWGQWGNAPWKFWFPNQANRTQPAGTPHLVYTKGQHPSWQILITSMNNDTSAIGVVMFEGRSNKATFYSVPGITIESAALKAFQTSNENLKSFVPVHPSIHSIYGELTWTVAYISTDANTDGAEPFQAIGFLHTKHTDGASVSMAVDKASALAKYRQRIARGNSNAAPEEGGLTKTVQGTVTNMVTLVITGNTNYLIKLDAFPQRIFQGAARDDDFDLPFIKQGDQVVITYLDIGKPRVDISSISIIAPSASTPLAR